MMIRVSEKASARAGVKRTDTSADVPSGMLDTPSGSIKNGAPPFTEIPEIANGSVPKFEIVSGCTADSPITTGPKRIGTGSTSTTGRSNIMAPSSVRNGIFLPRGSRRRIEEGNSLMPAG